LGAPTTIVALAEAVIELFKYIDGAIGRTAQIG
jgi:hypothetical protein